MRPFAGGPLDVPPLHIVVQQNNEEKVRMLISAHGTKDSSGNTALHVSAQRGHTNMIKILLHAGVRADIQNNWGEMAYDQAMDMGMMEAAQLLQADKDKPE